MSNSNNLKSLAEIFNNSFFRIPDYQRGYAWQREQLEDFWEDIMNLKEGKYHYTGVLTVENIDSNQAKEQKLWEDDEWLYEKGFKSFYVIDGQQRLLTIMILLKTILSRFDEDEEINYASKDEWIKKYFYQSTKKYEAFIFGYEKDNPSDAYYKVKILEKKDIKSSRELEETLYTANLKNAKQFFETKCKKLSKEELESIVRKLSNGLRFNFYEIDNQLDVFVTFETMNNRGKQLSKLELLKNRLIYLSTLLQDGEDDKRQLRRDINDAWKNIYKYLGKNKERLLDDDKFLENHWTMYFTYSRQEAKAFSKFLLNEYFTVESILNEAAINRVGFDQIKEYIQSISECVEVWFYIFNPAASPYKEAIQVWLEKLNRLRIGSFAPLIMAALVREADEKKIVQLLQEIERFIFLVFKVTNRKSNTGNSLFYRVAHELYFGDRTIMEAIKEIRDYVDCKNDYMYGVDISEFKNFIENKFKRQEEGFAGWESGIKYLLYEYELYLQKISKGNIKIEWDDIKANSIEYIYPQTQGDSSWGKVFGRYGYKNKEKYRLLHSLGNLLLPSMSQSKESQSKDFEYKKRHQDKHGKWVGYFNGSYSEIEVAQYSSWTPKEIYARGINILKFMENRWAISIDNKAEILGLDFMQ